ncbi:DUF2637 domain-containing protein [Streptomyces sp. NPDC015492]|uniref:DUF2637 domain-containing protein n=1 Tax=Streptomyces sp. NPDC015492 TaxID=3364958 RepID=UPI0036FC2B00
MSNRPPKTRPQPQPLPFPAPRTRAEVAANRRAYLGDRPGLERCLTWVIVGIVALVAIAGAAGSIYNLVMAAEAESRSAVSGIAAWSGAEGFIIVTAVLLVGFNWRGQRPPSAARFVMWTATAFALWLNVSATGGLAALERADTLTMLAIAAPLGTLAGVEGLSVHARSTVDMRTGADIHAMQADTTQNLTRASTWTTRAAAWEDKRARGAAARFMARRRLTTLAHDIPEVADTMRGQVLAFLQADASYAPALPAPAARPDEDAEDDEAVTLERLDTGADSLPVVPAPRRPELPSSAADFAAHVKGVYAALGVAPVVTVRVPLDEHNGDDETDTGTGAEPEPEHAKADDAATTTDGGIDDMSTETPEVATAVDTTADTEAENDEAEEPETGEPTSKADRLAAANRARAAKAKADRADLAQRWWKALDADPGLTKTAFVASAGASRQTLTTAISENPRRRPE